MRIIVIRPSYDVTTKYISAWAEKVVKFAETRGFTVIDLEKEKAKRSDFEGRIKKLEANLIFINGHGNESCIFGQDNNLLIGENNGDNLLAGKITYALSCESAKKLGLRVSEYKNSAYIGYLDEFIFLLDSRYVSRPADDPKSKPFMESSNQVMISLIKGNTAEESSEKSKRKFLENFIKLSSSASDPDTIQSMRFLRWNMMNQVCLGDRDALAR
ncbi:MAG: hypothetical protein Q8N69_02625 [bacterium]|nr:hypothetical protein [bacterium]